MKIDLFCHVVDNFGDAGVSARLARQLANEEGCEVRFWIDDLACLARLWPAIDAGAGIQRCAGIEVRPWDAVASFDPTVDVVIDAFGCGLPAAYTAAMANRQPPPLWINLEYLTAEDFAASCHTLPSPQPNLPLTRHFFFPGFAAGTGGLPRERDLAARRQAFQAVPENPSEFLAGIGVLRPADGLLVSLFCYDNAALPALVATWEHGAVPVHCLIPAGSRDSVQQAFGLHESGGEVVRRGQLSAQLVPFVDQDDFDRLLWSCDLNFVRGEDSFLRAQWAHRAFVWQPYVQDKDAHLDKLNAFLDRYLKGLDAETALAARRMFNAWNGVDDIAAAWPPFAACLPALAAYAGIWEAGLVTRGSLASNLAAFCKNAVKSPV